MASEASTPRRKPIRVWSWPVPNGRGVRVTLGRPGLPCGLAVKRRHDAIAGCPAVRRGVEVLPERQRRGAMTHAERENMFGKAQFVVR